MQTATHSPISCQQPPIVTDIKVKDADLIRTSNPFIQTIHIWFWVFDTPLQQQEMCGHDMLNWLHNVENRRYATLIDYWYTVDPTDRDNDVARYMIYRTNQLN